MRKLISFLTLAILLASCVSTTQPTSSSPQNSASANDWLFNFSWITSKPQYSVGYVDKPGYIAADVLQPSLFGQVSWLNTILTTFALNEKLSMDEIESLARALFKDIPATPSSDYIRAIGISGYFSPSEPMILYLSARKPSDKAPKGSKIILTFTGNFIRTQDSKTGLISTKPIAAVISPGFNWFSNGVIFENSMVVRANDLFDETYKNSIISDAAGDKELETINLADLYIKDEIIENDKDIESNLAAIRDNASDPSKQCTAALNLFMYYLYMDDIVKAEDTLRFAEQLSKTLNTEFQKIVESEAKIMLEVYKRLKNKQ